MKHASNERTTSALPTLARTLYVAGLGFVAPAWLATSLVADDARAAVRPAPIGVQPPWQVYHWLFTGSADRSALLVALVISHVIALLVLGEVISGDYGAAGKFGYPEGAALAITRFHDRLPTRGGPHRNRVNEHDEIVRGRVSRRDTT